MKRVVVIGAGIGGLAAAAALARDGFAVTVLEAHVYPGGSAGTFYHQGYRFDAGATVAGGFYPGGPMDLLARRVGIMGWPAYLSEAAMTVHLPDGGQIVRWADERRHAEHRAAFGREGEAFWRWQEQTADLMWDLALDLPPWPPQTPAQVAALLTRGGSWLRRNARGLRPDLLLDAVRPASWRLHGMPERLRWFVDGQLMISAQTSSRRANALYAAAALDLPRRGVVHLRGGMGALAETLVQAVRQNGGTVLYRQQAQQIVMEGGKPVAVKTRQGGEFPADGVIANLTPWNLRDLLGEEAPLRLKRLPKAPQNVWGAFVVYVGLDESAVPDDPVLHHQVLRGEPLGEGNSLFLSLSPAWDRSRAPEGRRALTISTHTALEPWWQLKRADPEGYERRKWEYTQRILATAGQVIPQIQQAAELIMPGTPVTFEYYTHRKLGWVGGFPQTSLFRNWGPRLAPALWMVGDSIFPGQSTAAVALGGLRVASGISQELLGEAVSEECCERAPGHQDRAAAQRSQA